MIFKKYMQKDQNYFAQLIILLSALEGGRLEWRGRGLAGRE